MKKIKIIALIGKAGSGKNYLLEKICDNYEVVHEIVPCTTRPARFSETNGISYHFLSDNQFLEQHFIEQCVFRGWRYGTRYTDLDFEKINIGIFNLNGIEQLIKNLNVDLTVIYIKADDDVRLIRQLERESNRIDSNIDEIFRRYKADKEDFNSDRIQKIAEKVPFYTIINNKNDSYDDDVFILQDFTKIIDEVKNK